MSPCGGAPVTVRSFFLAVGVVAVREGRQMEERGSWGKGGPLGRGVCTNRLSLLPAVVNSTGANGSRFTIGGTMGSNALSFSGGPGVLRTYSIKTTSTAHRGTHH